MSISPPDCRPPVVVVTGPTASGKTRLAIEIALRFGGEIVNADSMQVYRHMDIGTAKPSTEQRSRVPHHLLDVVTQFAERGVKPPLGARRERRTLINACPRIACHNSRLRTPDVEPEDGLAHAYSFRPAPAVFYRRRTNRNLRFRAAKGLPADGPLNVHRPLRS